MINKPSDSVIRQILDLARWAPSGDNTQPWRFEVINEQHLVVHGHDTRHWCVYDLQGHASQLALGGLLETITIAASAHGLAVTAQRRLDSSDDHPIFDVRLAPHQGSANPLIPCIASRSVQRRPMRSHPLSAKEKEALEASVGSSFSVHWLEGWGSKFRVASLLFNNAKLRLTIPEAHAVHKRVIQWGARYSDDRMPGDSIGLDPIAAHLSSWLMQSWQRVDFFNTYLAGTWAPRIELDFVPALACAAHFVIAHKTAVDGSIDDYVAAGRAMQRFWLKAESLGLRLQPEMTPLIFSAYAREKIHFSDTKGATEHASRLAVQLSRLIGEEYSTRAVFMGRIGSAPPAKSRSLRLPLDRLMQDSDSQKAS